MKQPKDIHVISVIDTIDEGELVLPIEERLIVEALTAVIINFNSDGINEYGEIVSSLIGRGSCTYAPKKLDCDLKSGMTPLAKLSIEDPPKLELKALSSHLCYVFLRDNKLF